MKKIYDLLIVLTLICLFVTHSEAKSIIFFGDSRATELAMAQQTGCVSKAKTNMGEQIIRDGEIDFAGDVCFWNWPGSVSDFWVPWIAVAPNESYNYDISVISLGGNDILVAYSNLEKIQNIINWIRAFTEPFAFLNMLFHRELTPIDELFWLWHMQTVTDQAAYNVNLITNIMLVKNAKNKVIMNDIAPILHPHGGPVWDDWDLRAFLRVNLYINIFNNKLLKHAIENPFFISRVQFLWTSPSFWNNFANYYIMDGIHFNEAGLNNWGRLIAQQCVNAKWLEQYAGTILPTPTDPTDVNPPEFVLIPSGSWSSGALLWGFQESPDLPLDIEITDDKGIAGIIGPELADVTGYPTAYTYRVNLPTNVSNGEHSVTITVFDRNNNQTSLRITYHRSMLGPIELIGYLWYRVDVTYSSEVL